MFYNAFGCNNPCYTTVPSWALPENLQRALGLPVVGCQNPLCSCRPNCPCGAGCTCGLDQNRMLRDEQVGNGSLPDVADQGDVPLPDDQGDDMVSVPSACPTNDSMCGMILAEFQRLDPGAMILPQIGFPSAANGVCTITHALPGMAPLQINGLASHSPLANNALFSTECSDGQILNLYEVMLPDVPSSVPGEMSSAERYVHALNMSGLNVAGTHFHWWGTSPYMAAIHHQAVGMDPVEFARRTVDALVDYMHGEGEQPEIEIEPIPTGSNAPQTRRRTTFRRR